MSKTDTKPGKNDVKSKSAEEQDATRRAVKARQKANRGGATKKSTTQVPFSVGRKRDAAEARALKARENHAFKALETSEYMSLKSGSTAEVVARTIIGKFPYVELADGEKRTNVAVNDALAELGFDPTLGAVRYGERCARLALRKAFYGL